MKFAAILTAFGLFLAMQGVQAQDRDTKIQVSVSHSGEDSVGKQFAYAVREAMRASNGFRLVPDEDSVFQVLIVTVDPAQSPGSYWTVASVTYTMTNFLPYEKGNPQTWYPVYLTSQVMTVGAQRVNEQARAVMAALDNALESYRREARESRSR